MRLAYGAGAMVALSAVTAGLVQYGGGTTSAATTTEVVTENPPAAARAVEVHHVIEYVHLKPGEVAPPGATVITPDAPAPKVVVTHIAGVAPPPIVQRIVVTRQSGKP